MSLENKKENRYVKNSIDYSYYDCEKETEQNSDDLNEFEDMCILSDSDCLDLLDDCACENEISNDQLIDDIDELLMLGFFNDFTLIDIGMGDFIREVYFEE